MRGQRRYHHYCNIIIITIIIVIIITIICPSVGQGLPLSPNGNLTCITAPVQRSRLMLCIRPCLLLYSYSYIILYYIILIFFILIIVLIIIIIILIIMIIIRGVRELKREGGLQPILSPTKLTV